MRVPVSAAPRVGDVEDEGGESGREVEMESCGREREGDGGEDMGGRSGSSRRGWTMERRRRDNNVSI